MKFFTIAALAILLSSRWGSVTAEVESTREASSIDLTVSAEEQIYEEARPANSNGLRGKTHDFLAQVDSITERKLLTCPAGVGPVQWGNYHWNKCTIDVQVERVLSNTNWRNLFSTSINNWNVAARIQVTTSNLSYSNTTANSCSPTTGKIRVCNNNYGATGWLGVAGIWAYSDGSIARAYTKVNDYYFSPTYNNGYYNNNAWRGSVMCQELGHDFGLDHWDEDFDTYCDSCMDYSKQPKNYPNQLDRNKVDSIHALQCTRRLQGNSCDNRNDNPPTGNGNAWGHQKGKHTFETDADKCGRKWITHVYWADENHGDGH
jgi:hypothetical protein